MVTIKEIRVRNFQAHAKLKIEFGPVSTIVGPSDTGKSAVIRAILWTLTNRPSGDAMVRHGETTCTVGLRWGESVITRTRGKGENTYKLDGNELKAFGQGVPEEILELTKLTDDSPQLQRQHDSHYWLSSSAGEVAKKFNSIIGLEAIDSSLRHLNTKSRSLKSKVEVIENELTEVAGAIEEKSWVATAEEEMVVLEDLSVQATHAEDDAFVLSGLVNELQEHLEAVAGCVGLDIAFFALAEDARAAHRDARAAASCSDLVAAAQTALEAAEAPVPSVVILTAAEKTLETTVEASKALEELITAAQWSSKTLEEGCPSLEEMQRLCASADDLAEQVSLLNRRLVYVAEHQREIQAAEEDLKEAEQALVGAVCPECGQEICA